MSVKKRPDDLDEKMAGFWTAAGGVTATLGALSSDIDTGVKALLGVAARAVIEKHKAEGSDLDAAKAKLVEAMSVCCDAMAAFSDDEYAALLHAGVKASGVLSDDGPDAGYGTYL